MTEKHTRGPWLVTKDKHGMDANHSLVCAVENGAEDMTLLVHAEAEPGDPLATANLIAAAPDLLDALAALLENIEGGDIVNFIPDPHLQQQARAAITKATKA